MYDINTNGVKMKNGHMKTIKDKRTKGSVTSAEHRGSYVVLKSVFVISMLTLSPSMLNSSVKEKNEQKNVLYTTEVCEQPQVSHLSTIDSCEIAPANPQQSPFPQIAYFNSQVPIKKIISAIGNDIPVKIVLAGYNPGKEVDVVHYIMDSYKDGHESHIPPRIYELVYHDLGPDKGFLGAKIIRHLYDPDTGKLSDPYATIREVRLDDVSAEYLLDFRAGDTEWVNRTGIDFSVTKDSKTMPTKFLED